VGPNVPQLFPEPVDELRPDGITRDLDWGGRCPVPLDGWRDRTDKRIYVWVDAVIGTCSRPSSGPGGSGDPDAWRAWWAGSRRRGLPYLINGQRQHSSSTTGDMARRCWSGVLTTARAAGWQPGALGR